MEDLQHEKISEILRNISFEMSHIREVQALLHLVAKRLPEIIKCDRASVALITPHKTDHFHVFALSGNRALIINQDYPLANSAIEHCIQQAMCTYFPKLEGSPWREHATLLKGGLRSTACAPLLSAGRIIGTLNVGSKTPDGFDQAAQQYLTQIALLLAVYIDNLRAMESTRRQIASVERLQHFGQQIANISHELKSPVATSLNELSILTELGNEFYESIGHPDVTPNDLREIAQDVKKHIHTLHVVMQRTANFLQALSDKTHHLQSMSNEDFFLADEMEESLRYLQDIICHHNIEVVLENVSQQAQTHGDPSKFRQMVTYLFTNAIEAMHEVNQRGTLTISTRQDTDNLYLIIQDDGPGIKDTLRERIFDHLFTSHVHSTGLGLSLSRDIMQGLFHGSLILESSETGARFVAQFPLQRHKTTSNQPLTPYKPFEGVIHTS